MSLHKHVLSNIVARSCNYSSFLSSQGEEWTEESQKIRMQANQVFMKWKSAFIVPEGHTFWDEFETQVMNFRDATKELEKKKVLALVSDPVTKAAAASVKGGKMK